MAKFKVLKKFKDKETKEVYDPGKEIDMTVKRSEEVADTLDDTFLERLDGPKKKADSDGDD